MPPLRHNPLRPQSGLKPRVKGEALAEGVGRRSLLTRPS